MTRRELEAAIQCEKDPGKVALLFHELMERERGKPTREIAEIAKNATDLELEQLIEAERDQEKRGMLFRELCRREEYRRKNWQRIFRTFIVYVVCRDIFRAPA